MLIGKRIKKIRKKKGLSQEELGNLIGVTKVSICGYENGTRTPNLDTFCLLAKVFETSTDYLLGREVTVLDANEKDYIGKVSKEDIEIIEELKNNSKLYERILKDIKRYIGLINKKML